MAPEVPIEIHQCECENCKGRTDPEMAQHHYQINLFLSRLNAPQRRGYVGLLSQKPGSPSDRQLSLITGLDEKTIVSEPGQRTRIRRQYDDVRTPFDPLCAAQAFSPEHLAQLTALREQTNPGRLLAQIEAQLEYIFSLPCAEPGETQIIYDTLSHIPDPGEILSNVVDRQILSASVGSSQ